MPDHIEELTPAELELMKSTPGNPIPVIKAVRKRTFCGVKTAKESVEVAGRRLKIAQDGAPSVEMKNCPFCGSSLVSMRCEGDSYWVQCMYCDARGPSAAGVKAQDRAACMWNGLLGAAGR